MALLDSANNLAELENVPASRVNLEVYSWSEVYPIGQTYNRSEINAKIASGSGAVRRYFRTTALDPIAWCTLGTVILSDGTYSALNFLVQVNKGNSSWGNANVFDSYQFLVKFTRSDGIEEDIHSIEIIGPKVGMLRGRIYDNKYFELQFSADDVSEASYGYSMSYLSGSESDWSTATWLDPMDKVPGIAAPGIVFDTTTTETLGVVTHLQSITQNGSRVVDESKPITYGNGLAGSSSLAGTQNIRFSFPSMPTYTGTSDNDLLPVYNSTTGVYQKITKGDLIPDAAGIRIKGTVVLNTGNTGTVSDDTLNATITAGVAPNTAGSADPAKGYSYIVTNSSLVTSLITGTAEQFELSDQVFWTGSLWKRLPAFGGTSVRTFNTRSGDVVAVVGDYTASMVNGATAGGLTGRTVQQALDYKPDSNQTETITGSWTFTPIVTLSNGATVPNPANTLASLIFGWNANIPRLRVGGSGTGSAESFEIQGLGDAVRLSVGASESYIGTAKYKIWHAGNSNLSTIDWSVKDLYTANNVYLANNKFVYGKDTVGLAKTVIGIDATNKTIVGNTSNQLVLYTASNNPLVSNGSLSYAVLHDGNIAAKNYAVKTVNETITGLWTHSEGINMSNNKAIQGTARGTKLPAGNKYNLVKLDNDDDILVGADTARMGFFSNDPANLWLVSEIGNPARQYRMYNEGFKPTAADVGAAPTNHTHAYAPLTGAGTSGSWPISVTGSSASTTGNSATATVLQTARTIAISGAVTGTATSFNGGANITIAATALNASNLSAGTVPDARISGAYTGMTNLTGSGTVDFSRFLGNATDTVAAPSFSWTGDLDTGIYSPAADQLAITTGGVQRALFNSSGVTATTFRGALIGNATTATTLQTARTINGVSFNGSANITITAAANGGTSAACSGNSATATNLASISNTFSGKYPMLVNANGVIYGHTSVQFEGATGILTVPTVLGNLSGNATTATTLQTARTLTTTLTGDVTGSASLAFNGSSNATVTVATTVANDSHTHGFSTLSGVAQVQGRTVSDCNAATFRVSGMYGFNNLPTNGPGEPYGAMIVAANSDTGLQIAGGYSTDDMYFRGWSGSGTTYYSWRRLLHNGNYNLYSPTLTGTGASGTWGINVTGTSGGTTGNAATATVLQTARTLTIGSTGKSFNGSANVAWSLAEIGAQPAGSYAAASHTHTPSQVGLGNVPNTVHTTAATASTVAVRDSAGDIACRLLRPNYANEASISGALAFRVNNSTDNYLRFCSDTAAIRTWLGVAAASHTHSYAPLTGAGTSGTWPISVSGNAATATNAVAVLSTGAVVTLQTSAVGGYFNFTSSGASIAAGVRVGSLIATNSYANAPPPIGQITATQFNGALNGNATTATRLQTARTINGVSFNGSANITITAAANGGTSAACSGNAATATVLQTARTLTIGSKGKSFNGSANVAWSLAEIGAQPAGSYAAASHSHPVGQLTGLSATGVLKAKMDLIYSSTVNNAGTLLSITASQILGRTITLLAQIDNATVSVTAYIPTLAEVPTTAQARVLIPIYNASYLEIDPRLGANQAKLVNAHLRSLFVH